MRIRDGGSPLLGKVGSGLTHRVGKLGSLSTAAHCRLVAELRDVPGRGGMYRKSFGPDGIVMKGGKGVAIIS